MVGIVGLNIVKTSNTADVQKDSYPLGLEPVLLSLTLIKERGLCPLLF